MFVYENDCINIDNARGIAQAEGVEMFVMANEGINGWPEVQFQHEDQATLVRVCADLYGVDEEDIEEYVWED